MVCNIFMRKHEIQGLKLRFHNILSRVKVSEEDLVLFENSHIKRNQFSSIQTTPSMVKGEVIEPKSI